MNKKDLIQQIFEKKSLLCVGLDSDIEKVPHCVYGNVYEFNRRIIDATIDLAIAYKINTAFYEVRGSKGWEDMKKTIDYIRSVSPNTFIIADAKRGDIGNTSLQYAHAFLSPTTLNVDAITVSPYMGVDSVQPFYNFPEKWVIILALTSNKGAQDFQLLSCSDGKYLFEHILEKASSWGTPDNTMFVVGATQAKYLSLVRKIVPNHFLLIPGIGAQGGDLEAVLENVLDKNNALVLINISRSIIFATQEKDFAQQARANAIKMVNEMRKIMFK